MNTIQAPTARFILALLGALLLCLGCAGETGADGELGEESEALCKGARLSVTPSGPVTGTVTLTSSPAACAAGEMAEYRFGYQRDGTSSFVELQTWSPASTATWDTTGLPSGSYHAYVHARATGSSKAQMVHGIVVLVGQVCTGVTLATDAASPQSVGADIVLAANATCTSATPEYQFLAKHTDGATTIVQDWSLDANVNWRTAGAQAGWYRLTVLTRARNNLGFEAQRTLSFRLGETCGPPVLSATPPSPAAPGDIVELSATASCTRQASPEYRFSYHPSAANTWTVLRDWGEGASVSWPTTALAPDDYRLRIETRANDYAGPRQGSRAWTYVVGPWCQGVGLNVTPKSPPALNAVLTLTGDAACNGAAAEYRFWVRAPEQIAYAELGGWGPATAVFDTTGLDGGSYVFKVQARAVGNISSYQSQRAVTYRVGHVCGEVTLAASPKSPSLRGAPVALKATAACANAGAPEFQFMARAAGSDGWTLLRDWGPDSAVWDTASPPWNALGDYRLKVSVRGQGQLGGAESSRTISHALQAGCLTDAVYDIQTSGSYVEQESTNPPRPGVCGTIRTRSYQTTLRATVNGGGVDVVGSRFAGRYTVIENTASGFSARADESGHGFSCGGEGEYEDTYGEATLTFNCATAMVTFEASCIGDTSTDGCYPNYSETASGSGPRILSCPSGYHVAGDTCVDDDECAQRPCAGLETCVNTPGSFTCSCVAPAETCGGSCVSLASDTQNCGACGNTCSESQSCWEGVCGSSCPAGYQNVAGTCVDIDECAAGSNDCSPRGTCTNTPGSFSCACRPGYVGDGRYCNDYDECRYGSPCAEGESCTNTEGSFSCSCLAPRLACGQACVDAKRDAHNCGGCGDTCSEGQGCADGRCENWSWSTMGAGAFHTCGIVGSGGLLCWGSGLSGQTTAPSGTFSAVSGGSAHSCALRDDGTITCFGDWVNQAAPPAGVFRKVSSRGDHSCGLRNDGSLACWGFPANVSNVPNGTFIALSAGNWGACAVRTNGAVECWAQNFPSTLPAGTFTDVACGYAHNCALRSDGAILCWKARDSAFPAPPAGTYVALASGLWHACALRADGTAVCWGSNGSGESTPPSDTFVSISAGTFHTCGIRTDGSAVCWGRDTEQQCDVPAP